MDGSASSDPNNLPGSLAFSWSCKRTDKPGGTECPANRYLSAPEYHQAVVTLPPTTILPGEYLFTLAISKPLQTPNRGQLSAVASVKIVVIWEDVPTVSLDILDESNLAPQYLSYNDRVQLPDPVCHSFLFFTRRSC